MTIYEPNPEVASTGEEAGEFLEPDADDDRVDEDGAADPSARPTGSPPVE